METPIFFKNKDYRLFGVLHEPVGVDSTIGCSTSAHARLGFVFCHPFAEEKLASHRIMVNLARSLAKKNISCLRFDYMGHGESEGKFEDSTVKSRISDIGCAAEYLRGISNVGRVGLVGVRFGATLAAIACKSSPAVELLVLISPVIDGKAYAEEMLRSNLAAQVSIHRRIMKDRKTLIKELREGEKVNVDGYLLTGKLYDEMSSLNALQEIARGKYVLIIELLEGGRQKIREETKNLEEGYRSADGKVKLIGIPGFQFWKDGKVYRSRVKGLHDEITRFLGR
jgi:alpha/beta superfamily hydrolase